MGTFVKKLPNSLTTIEDARQVVKSSGSVGANYIEENESLSNKDFALRVKICRKEAKETVYWLKLLEMKEAQTEREQKELVQEATELMKIFGAILQKTR